MSLVAKRFLVGAFAVSLCLASVVPDSTARPVTQSTKPSSPIRDCVSQKGRLGALFLIDQSGSLQETDPLDRRVQAMKAAVAALSLNAELKTTTEKDYVLEVRFDGFGAGYTSTGKWHTLTLASNLAAEAEIEAFAIRDDESQTDYKSGLELAVQALAEYEQSVGADVCKLLVWLSDGELYLGNENSDDAEIEAANEMCAADNGIADQMRSLDIYTVGFGLTTTSGIQPDFTLMEGLVTGSAGCGARAGFGRFVKVEGADALIQALFRDLSPIPPDSKPVSACKDEPSNTECGEFRFFTRPPLDRVKMIVSTTVGINTAEIIEPGGVRTAFVSGGSAIPASSAAVSSSPLYQFTSIVSINVTKSVAPYGEWVVQFRGPAARDALVSALFFSDVIATIEGADPLLLERDSPAPFVVRIAELGTVGLQLPTGTTEIADFDKAPSIEATFTVGSVVVPTEVMVTNADEGVFEVRTAAADLANVGPLGKLQVRPVARLNGVDIAFGDTYRDVKVLLGDGMPTIGKVSASNIDDDGVSTISIELTGPEEGVGRAELSNAFEILDSPQPSSTTDFVLTPKNGLVEVRAGQTAEIAAEFDPNFTANGNLSFRLNISLEGRSQKQVSIPLDFEIKMTRPFNTGRAIGWLIGMVVVFLLTQAAAVAIAATILARVRSLPIWTRTASFPVTVFSDGGITSGGVTIADRLRDYRTLPEALSSAQAHHIEGLRYSVSRGAAIGSLVSPQPVKVTAELIGSTRGGLFGDSGRVERDGMSKAVVRSELFGSWVFQTLEHREGSVDGHLTVILPRDLDDPATFAFELEGALRGSGLIDASADTEPVATPDGSAETSSIEATRRSSRKGGDVDAPKPASTGPEPRDIDPFS